MPTPHPYQQAAIEKALHYKRWILADQTGLGKSAEAVVVAREMGAERILVVCPSSVKAGWKKEFGVWYPDHPPLGRISFGLGRKLSKKLTSARSAAYECPIQVVSYNLLKNIKYQNKWDLIILDEFHRCKGQGSSWSTDVAKLLAGNRTCPVLGLTATLVPNNPKDVWQLVDLLWPGRFGKYWKYIFYYMNVEKNEYGCQPIDLKEGKEEELAQRIAALSSRTTRQEVAHLLPPFDCQMLVVDPDWRSGSRAINQIETDLELLAHSRISAVVDWVRDIKESCTHICVLTKHKVLAAKLRDRLIGAFPRDRLIHINGQVPTDKRAEYLDRAKAADSIILVATMESVSEGIDNMTWATQVLFAELDYSPKTMTQTMGRFSRLSGKLPSICTLMCTEGTQDEVLANRLMAKIADINKMIKPGQTEKDLEKTLDEVNRDWESGIESFDEGDEYGI